MKWQREPISGRAISKIGARGVFRGLPDSGWPNSAVARDGYHIAIFGAIIRVDDRLVLCKLGFLGRFK